MTDLQWKIFTDFRNNFINQCQIWKQEDPWLIPLIKKAHFDAKENDYPIENGIVYNTSLDELTRDSTIKLILVSDNPGKNEQLNKNKRYLIGQAGKLADHFFKNNPDLDIDFRTQVIILNKTPIHTAKTKQLAFLLKNNSPAFTNLYKQTQSWLAFNTLELAQALKCPLWIVGYSELHPKGLFSMYAQILTTEAHKTSPIQNFAQESIFLYQHFSMNRFSIDLKDRYNQKLTLKENLYKIGLQHRKDILQW